MIGIRILIMSCGTGGGHDAAAVALCEMLKRKSVYCELLDTLTLAGDWVNRFACDTYLNITVKVPCVFGYMYNIADAVSRKTNKSPIYYMNSLYAQRLSDYLTENKFDAVVMTHLFAAEALTKIREEGMLKIPFVFVLTDYTCIPFLRETCPDRYILPSSELADECIKKGVPEEKIFPLGIPINPDFQIKVPKDEARRQLGLPLNKPVYLVMSGSMGFGDIEKLAKTTLAIYGGNINLVILCGNNKGLYESLCSRYENNKSIIPKEFTDRVSLYMNAGDVVFSKPGGLTSTEAAVSCIPLIHTRPIPGCELKNAAFFSSRGMSYYSDDVVSQLSYAYRLTHDEHCRNQMIKAQKKYINPDACENICDLLISL